MDFRDADYEDGNGFGTGYSSADMYVWYNHADSLFYKDAQMQNRIWGSITIWDAGGKSSGPRIPVTVNNSFDGSDGGDVSVGGGSQSSPYKAKWDADDANHAIAAVTPQTVNGLIYQFSSWSDGGAASHNVSASLANFAKVWTASFSVQKPTQVTGVTAGGTIGEPVHVTWDMHSNADVNYAIYRKVRHNGVTGSEVLLSTVSHSTTSFDDPDYTLVGHSSDLLYYDVRAHHVPSGTYADAFWTCAGYGEIEPKWSPPGRDHVTVYGLGAHPNPFNPSTTIEYQLPKPGNVSLVVFDINGRQVAQLAHGMFEAGRYTARWDGTACASGVYYLRFTVANSTGGAVYSKTEKLLLMK